MQMNNPWEKITPPSEDVSARRVDHTHPLDLFWARDHLGHYLLIYEFPPPDKDPKSGLPDLIGIQTAYIPSGGDNESTGAEVG